MRAFVLVPVLLVAACAQPASVANDAADIGTAANRAQGDIDSYAANTAMLTPVPPASAKPGRPGRLANDRTVSEAPFNADSAQGAANVIQTYYALIGEGRYRQAWALWSGKGEANGQSADAFATGFAKYREYHANVGAPGEIEAGAGQRYVTVPVQAHARLKSGALAYWIGSAVLHRTGDIDGTTVEDKAWRIKSIDLKPA